jgi:hypothetical protein
LGLAQPVPQAAQLFGSLDRLTQLPLQQTAPFPHTVPQVPQWFGSLRRFTSQPSATSPLQLAKPALQLATVQAPFAQPAVPLATAQALLQLPQLAVLVCRLTQSPLQSV